MNRVRVGIVGSRFAARIHVDGYKRCPEAEVVAVASPNVDHVRSFIAEHNIPQCYTDYREMFRKADIDLVSVCVPNYLHRDVTISAAEAGKHVICEKPLATSLRDAGEMVEVCEKNGVKLMYAEDWLFSPMLTRAKEICQEGAVGQVLYLKAKETHSGSHSIFAKRLNYCGGGAMIHLGIHPIGFARWFKQKEVVGVSARVSGGGKLTCSIPISKVRTGGRLSLPLRTVVFASLRPIT
ncbi:MAG TPA: Gfo/Idh/MocA family oxidoreductase [Candidatus Latescibacteria bacterium]|nr:Gfo/Idh/MocA family oxidoreductase [Candidatus Latescibacterota bacterium]